MTGDLRPASDPFSLLAEDALSAEEEHYIGAARAANTVRGYRSDWSEFTAWCASKGRSAIPAEASTITGYLTTLAGHGAKVGTMSRRLSAIKSPTACRTCPTPPIKHESSQCGRASAASMLHRPTKRHR